ncbi:acetyl-coenzyme A synthetase N-terminal domain-containing protein, partial [Rhodovulum tesquicola]|uniref:acetyl-coenzyme A synthetase N-terminal domain-containing protein n=1 Tax=Rhodovulum tesquicola TaxID=540254 RepID=UPI0025B77714
MNVTAPGDDTDKLYAPSSDFVRSAHVDGALYAQMYRRSVEDPEGFWGEHGRR